MPINDDVEIKMVTTNKVLGREDFLAGATLRRELVPVPELGGELWMRELGTTELLKYKDRLDQMKAGHNSELSWSADVDLMAYAILLSACDSDGNLLFNDDDLPKIMRYKLPLLIRLSSKALELSELEMDKLGNIQNEVAANLKKGRMTSLSSSSPKNFRKRKRK